MSIAINPVAAFELGEMHRHDNTTATDILTTNAWVLSVGMLEGITRQLEFHDDVGGTYLKIPLGSGAHNGNYWITWSASATGHQGDTYEFGIAINGTVADKTIARSDQGVQGSVSMSGTALLELVEGDEIQGAIRNITDNYDITVVHSNIAIVRI